MLLPCFMRTAYSERSNRERGASQLRLRSILSQLDSILVDSQPMSFSHEPGMHVIGYVILNERIRCDGAFRVGILLARQYRAWSHVP